MWGTLQLAPNFIASVMQPSHTEAVVNSEGKVVLSLPFPIGEKVDVVVLSSHDVHEDNDWKDLAAKEFLRGLRTKMRLTTTMVVERAGPYYSMFSARAQ